MAFAVVANTKASLGQNGGTTSAINTSGADLIVMVCSWWGHSASGYTGALTVTDSKSNTYSYFTRRGGDERTQIAYVVSPSVGSGHTWTISHINGYWAIVVYAFSGVNTGSATDGESAGGTTGGATSLSTGAATPSQDGALLIAALCADNSSAHTINSAFTADVQAYTAGVNMVAGLGYKIQPTAATENPTWSWTTASNAAAALAIFKAAPAAAGGQPTMRRWGGVPHMGSRHGGGW